MIPDGISCARYFVKTAISVISIYMEFYVWWLQKKSENAGYQLCLPTRYCCIKLLLMGYKIVNVIPPLEEKYHISQKTVQWRHNGHDGVSNHQPRDCLLNPLFREIKENINAPRQWPLCLFRNTTRNRSPVNSPHKGPVTRKLLPSDDVIVIPLLLELRWAGDFFC